MQHFERISHGIIRAGRSPTRSKHVVVRRVDWVLKGVNVDLVVRSVPLDYTCWDDQFRILEIILIEGEKSRLGRQFRFSSIDSHNWLT